MIAVQNALIDYIGLVYSYICPFVFVGVVITHGQLKRLLELQF